MQHPASAELTPFDLALLPQCTPPPIRPKLVNRNALFSRLAATDEPIVLVRAPAGWGKTTLLAAWSQQSEHKTAWASLSADDNDPVRFWRVVLLALGQCWPELGLTARVLLALPEASPRFLVPLLLRDLTREAHEGGALILDDYHMITTERIHADLTWLADHLPAHMRLIMSGRHTPALPLARWRAQGRLLELHNADLRFSIAETEQLLNRVYQLELSATSVALSHERTEGWVAGLHLLAVASRPQENREAFISRFQGSHNVIADYVLEEILDQHHPEIRSFLLHTAALDKLTGALCDALTGSNTGTAMLHTLEQTSLFVSPLDSERHWYRYHQLFAEALRSRVASQDPHALQRQHRRAAAWYAGQGMRSEAVQHALDGDDWEQAARFISKATPDLLWREGTTHLLQNWLSALPETMFSQYPMVLIARVWLHLFAGRLGSAEADLASVVLSPGEHAPSILGTYQAALSFLALRRGDLERCVQLAELALPNIPSEHLGERAFLWRALSRAQQRAGNLVAAEHATHEIERISRLQANDFLLDTVLAQRAALALIRGQFTQLLALGNLDVGLFLDPAEVGGSQRLYSTYVGVVAYERNNLEEASRCFTQALAVLEPTPWMSNALLMKLWLARTHQARGDQAAADACLARLEPALARCDDRDLLALAALHVAQIRLMQGSLGMATRWAEAYQQRSPALHAGLPPNVERDDWEQLTYAWWLLASEQPAVAQTALTPLRKATLAGGRIWSAVECLGLEALAADATGAFDTAQTLFAEALRYAEPEGMIRVFADKGAHMARLVRQYAGRRPTPYLARLTDACAATKPATVRAETRLPDAPERLSPRERDVLQLMAQGKSDAEIAHRLGLALSTVKSHARQIYAKLGVRNRTAAVTAAHQAALQSAMSAQPDDQRSRYSGE